MVCFSILPQTCRGTGTSGIPTVSAYTSLSPSDRGQAKAWRCGEALPRFEVMSVGSTLGEEAATDGSLFSQLLLCPILPVSSSTPSACAWVDYGTPTTAESQCVVVPGSWAIAFHSVKVIKQTQS